MVRYIEIGIMPVLLRHDKDPEFKMPDEISVIRGKIYELIPELVYCYLSELDFFGGNKEKKWIERQLELYSKRKYKTEEDREKEALAKRPAKKKKRRKAVRNST